MKERKRIYLSVDTMTYEKLSSFARRNKFKNECEVVASMVHVMLDRLENADARQYDIPDADGEYIDNMFDDMAHITKQADGDGSVSIIHRNRHGNE